MIRKILVMLLSVAVVLTMMPTMVFAGSTDNTKPGTANGRTVTSYDLWIGNKQVTSENSSDILGNGTVSYNAEKNILMLNNANLDTNNSIGVHTGYSIASVIFADNSIGTLTVHVTGENSIRVTQYGMIAAGIYAYHDIIFEGDGSLSVSALSLGSEGNAVYAHTGDVTINSGTYDLKADGTTGSNGIFANSNSGTVYANGGTLTVSTSETTQAAPAISGKLDFSSYSGCEITASVNASGTPETTYIPENQNIYRLYKYLKIWSKPVVIPIYDEDGFQTNGDGYEPAELADDIYQIKNAGNLFWFAQQVKTDGANNVINAQLVNDIIIPDGRTWTPISVAISAGSRSYTGTFDGKGHTISGLETEGQHGGLFGSLAEKSVVKNLGIINSSFESGSTDYVGAIAATNYGTIENCYNTGTVTGWNMFVGGIVGENKGTIRECYNTGTIAANGLGESAGGICGIARDDAVIINCYNTGSVSGRWGISGICGCFNDDTIRISNCYNTGSIRIVSDGIPGTSHDIAYAYINYNHDEADYLAAAENCYYLNDTENQTGGKTQAQFASGEVAWLLNNETTASTWGQTLGTEAAPVLKGATVYGGYEYCYSDSITYSNHSGQVHVTKPAHVFEKLECDEDYHWYSCTNDGCTATDGKEQHNGGTATYFEEAVCEVCEQPYGDLLKDTIPPTGKISIDENKWDTFLNTITFNLFFNQTQRVEISAWDDSYDVTGYTEEQAAVIEYCLYSGDTALTKDELEKEVFTPYAGAFPIDPDDNYVIYVKITDHAGNVTYINSDGLVLDATAPAITGITNGSVYYTTQNITVADTNLASVTLNDKPVTGTTVTLDGNTNSTYTIVATDRAGNATTVKVTMRSISDIAEAFADLTAENVTSKNKDQIEQMLETVKEFLREDDITDSEKNALQVIEEDLDALLTQIENAVHAGNAESISNVKDITSDNVKPENRDDLIAAKKDLENSLETFGGNYTAEEEAELAKKLEQINNALDSIERAEAVQEAVTELPDTVNPDDTDAEKLIDAAKEQYDALTEHEKSLIGKESKEKLENLLKDLVDYRIIKGDGSQWTVEEKDSITMTANGAYCKFIGIQVDGKDVAFPNYTVASGSTVITLRPEYLNTLSTGKHTLTVLYTDGQTNGTFEILAKSETNTPQTSDDSNTSFWTWLMLAAAFGMAGIIIYSHKRNPVNNL